MWVVGQGIRRVVIPSIELTVAVSYGVQGLKQLTKGVIPKGGRYICRLSKGFMSDVNVPVMKSYGSSTHPITSVESGSLGLRLKTYTFYSFD